MSSLNKGRMEIFFKETKHIHIGKHCKDEHIPGKGQCKVTIQEQKMVTYLVLCLTQGQGVHV
jgi:hypothetical protein